MHRRMARASTSSLVLFRIKKNHFFFRILIAAKCFVVYLLRSQSVSNDRFGADLTQHIVSETMRDANKT